MHNFHFCDLFQLFFPLTDSSDRFSIRLDCDAKEMKTDANILQDFVVDKKKWKK